MTVKPILYLVRALPGQDLEPLRPYLEIRGGGPTAPPAVATRQLEDLGYRVIEAADGRRYVITAIGPTRAGLFLECLAIFIAFICASIRNSSGLMLPILAP